MSDQGMLVTICFSFISCRHFHFGATYIVSCLSLFLAKGFHKPKSPNRTEGQIITGIINFCNFLLT